MDSNKFKKEKRERRHKRVRAKIKGTSSVPRLCVFRSNNHIYAQLIDDSSNKIILSVSDIQIKDKKNKPNGKEELKGKKMKAFFVGKEIAKKAMDKKIEKVVFDRGGYKYHGRVKSLAEGARDGGLEF